MKEITSVNNELVKETAKLQQKKYRDEAGLFIIEGEKAVSEAIFNNVEIVNLFVFNQNISKEILDFNEEKTFFVSEPVMKKISATQSPPEVLAVAKQLNFSLEKILKSKKTPILVVLEGIKDGGNLGTIIRTFSAFDVDGVVLTGDTVDLYNPKVVRSAVGNLWKLPIIRIANSEKLVDDINKIKKCKFLSTVMPKFKGAKSFDNVSFKESTVIMFGSEAEGLSQELIDISDEFITISINKNVESLNLSVACGVILYEAFRQRIS